MKNLPLVPCFLLIVVCFIGGAVAQSVPQRIAADDFYVFENNPLYIAHNDQNPGTVTSIVSLPTHGILINNGQTVSYSPYYDPNNPYTGSDSFTYQWCVTEWNGQLNCSNVATVTLLVGADGSQNYRACQIGSRPSAPNSVASPINVTNGNMWLHQSDYALPGVGETLEIDRFYNSALVSSGLFGFGWTTKYDEFLTVYDGRMIKLNLPDAKGVFFGRPDTASAFRAVPGDFQAHIDKAPDSTYTLTWQDGRVHKFDAGGRLLWQRDRNGNQTTLTYDANNFLIGVTDVSGRSLTLTPNANGKIISISDSLGEIANYDYDATGVFLTGVNYPDGSKFKFGYMDKLVNGQTRRYLATVRDALDNILETHQYDSQGRAWTSEKQGGNESYTLGFASAYTTVTDVLGRTTRYDFTHQQGKNALYKVCAAAGVRVRKPRLTNTTLTNLI